MQAVKAKSYVLLEGFDGEKLAAKVEARLAEGWQLYGSPCCNANSYVYQAMILPQPKTKGEPS